jgi:hypothetical protein
MRMLLTFVALFTGSIAFAQELTPGELRPGLNPGGHSAPINPMSGQYREPPKIDMSKSSQPPPPEPTLGGATIVAIVSALVILASVCYPIRRPD